MSEYLGKRRRSQRSLELNHDAREQVSRASGKKTWHPSVQHPLIARNDLPSAISHACQVHLSLYPRQTLGHKEPLPD